LRPLCAHLLAIAELDENDDGSGGAGGDHGTGPQVYADEEGELPPYYNPPADGSSCFDELPIETIMHIFSFFSAGTTLPVVRKSPCGTEERAL
jgi:hypothetical protein